MVIMFFKFSIGDRVLLDKCKGTVIGLPDSESLGYRIRYDEKKMLSPGIFIYSSIHSESSIKLDVVQIRSEKIEKLLN